MSDMTGRVALITGASSGIGKATAEAFAGRGASVVVAARRKDPLGSLVSEIEARGGKATAIKTDVASAKDVERMIAHAIETFGRLDYAVNNARIEGQLAGINDLTEEQWDQVLDINLKGTFLCMKHEAAAMLRAGHGAAIVNVGSINSFLGFATGAAYVTSKHGMIGLTTCASAELASRGIRVNIVCPGIIDTPMHHRAPPDRGRRHLRQGHPAIGASAAGGQPGGDRPRDRLPLLRRGELHHRQHAHTGWGIHPDPMRLGMKARLVPLLLVAAYQSTLSSDPAEVRRVIEANNAKIVGWYAGGQADSVASFFAKDAWQLPPNSPPLLGRDSILSFWRGALKAGQWRFDLKTQDVLVSGPLAAERGAYTLEFVAGANAPFPSFRDQGNYVVVWRKEADGVWRGVWDAPVSTVPPNQPPAK
jgi:NAD(P)-dependent dehydrogenase (short-subunit alcohol dehydrogenase family)/ketosteroid isomerase-like protein